MTMDTFRRKDTVGEIKVCDDQAEVPMTKVTNKRSFDVAFLMLPDDKLKQKQMKASKQALVNYSHQILYNNNDKVDEIESSNSPIDVCISDEKPHNLSKIVHRPQVFDDPNLGKLKSNYEPSSKYKNKSSPNLPEQKSAFTKVNLIKEARLSPLSVSPDLSYQNSLSPSPPILNRQYQTFPTNLIPQNQIFKSQNTPYQNNFLQENFSPSPSTSIDSTQLLQPNFSKIRPIIHYRPEIPYLGANPYPNNFQPQDMLKINPPDIRHPAAAILTSLLPPSFAALSLPAQNVCAKCNISFRMTSDLVYHMRSHHKSDVANDLSKRRREEKLKCPVCAESFRERHHLTRHMTAHQDKEGDGIEPETKKKASYVHYSK